MLCPKNDLNADAGNSVQVHPDVGPGWQQIHLLTAFPVSAECSRYCSSILNRAHQLAYVGNMLLFDSLVFLLVTRASPAAARPDSLASENRSSLMLEIELVGMDRMMDLSSSDKLASRLIP